AYHIGRPTTLNDDSIMVRRPAPGQDRAHRAGVGRSATQDRAQIAARRPTPAPGRTRSGLSRAPAPTARVGAARTVRRGAGTGRRAARAPPPTGAPTPARPPATTAARACAPRPRTRPPPRS